MPDTPQRIVVIGGGLAGAKAVEALRGDGYEGSLTLIADEPDLPYERPPLSKDYLQGKAEFDKAVVHPADWYESHNVDLRQGVAAM
jgi:3-phenylpropionate/trans-cinnamate dioxygenase ferredoxin reductase subunit